MTDPNIPPESDRLAPSRGIAVALLTSIPIWAVILGLAYWSVHR